MIAMGLLDSRISGYLYAICAGRGVELFCVSNLEQMRILLFDDHCASNTRMVIIDQNILSVEEAKLRKLIDDVLIPQRERKLVTQTSFLILRSPSGCKICDQMPGVSHLLMKSFHDQKDLKELLLLVSEDLKE